MAFLNETSITDQWNSIITIWNKRCTVQECVVCVCVFVHSCLWEWLCASSEWIKGDLYKWIKREEKQTSEPSLILVALVWQRRKICPSVSGDEPWGCRSNIRTSHLQSGKMVLMSTKKGSKIAFFSVTARVMNLHCNQKWTAYNVSLQQFWQNMKGRKHTQWGSTQNTIARTWQQNLRSDVTTWNGKSTLNNQSRVTVGTGPYTI